MTQVLVLIRLFPGPCSAADRFLSPHHSGDKYQLGTLLEHWTTWVPVDSLLRKLLITKVMNNFVLCEKELKAGFSSLARRAWVYTLSRHTYFSASPLLLIRFRCIQPLLENCARSLPHYLLPYVQHSAVVKACLSHSRSLCSRPFAVPIFILKRLGTCLGGGRDRGGIGGAKTGVKRRGEWSQKWRLVEGSGRGKWRKNNVNEIRRVVEKRKRKRKARRWATVFFLSFPLSSLPTTHRYWDE